MASREIQELRKKLTAAKERQDNIWNTRSSLNTQELFFEARQQSVAIQSRLDVLEAREAGESEREKKVGSTKAATVIDLTEDEDDGVGGRSMTNVKKETVAGHLKIVKLERDQPATVEVDQTPVNRMPKDQLPKQDIAMGSVLKRTMIDNSTNQDNNCRRTFSDLNAMRGEGASLEIWDFKAAEWHSMRADVLAGPDVLISRRRTEGRKNDLLLQYVRRVAKVLYFCKYSCTLEDVERYIPKEIYLQFIGTTDLANNVQALKKDLHKAHMLQNVGRIILPRWSKQEGFPPIPFDVANDTDEDKAVRIAFFTKKAHQDIKALDQFIGGMRECVDFDLIKRQDTPEDVVAWKWAVKSLAEAANLFYEFHNRKGSQMIEREWATIRNRKWEDLGRTNYSNAPSPDRIPIPRSLGPEPELVAVPGPRPQQAAMERPSKRPKMTPEKDQAR